MQDELSYIPGYRLREDIVNKRISPVEATAATLDRIDLYNEELGAFITVCYDLSMAQAREAEQAVMRGDELGALHGIPVPIKDLEGVCGVRLTHGSIPADEEIATADALCVERIRDAGGIIVGKTNTPEFGYAATTESRVYGPCRNPWNPERTSGGSSGGSGSAVAAGLTPMAQGSDGGGSVRIPSALTGIYGVKATQGRIPRRQVDTQYWNPINNSSVGPMARTVRDGARLMQCLSGPSPDAEYGTLKETPPDFEAAIGRGVRGLKIAYSEDLGGAAVDPQVRNKVREAARVFQELGAVVEETEFTIDEPEERFRTFYDFFSVRGYLSYCSLVDDPQSRSQLTDYFRESLEHGRSLSAAEYAGSLNNIGRYRAYVSSLLEEYELLLTPTTSVAAFEIGNPPLEIDGRTCQRPAWGFFHFTYVFNLTGNPAASVPCGFSDDGLPIGLQLVGRLRDEETIVAASAAFEEARPWEQERPRQFE